MKVKDLRKVLRGVPGNTSIFVHDKKGYDDVIEDADVRVKGEPRVGEKRIKTKDVLLVLYSQF